MRPFLAIAVCGVVVAAAIYAWWAKEEPAGNYRQVLDNFRDNDEVPIKKLDLPAVVPYTVRKTKLRKPKPTVRAFGRK